MRQGPPITQVVQSRRLGVRTVEKLRMEFGKGEQLSRLKDFRFFSPAILYLYGGFTDEMLADFQRSSGRRVNFMFHLFAKPLFAGLGSPDGDQRWNSALWAVRAEFWEEFENFMLTVTLTDTPKRLMVRFASQDIKIADPLYERDAVSASVVVFGIKSNRNVVAMTTPVFPGPKPHLAFYPASAQITKAANAYMRSDINAAAMALSAGKSLPVPDPVFLPPLQKLPDRTPAEVAKILSKFKGEA